ncbi:MAG: serine/threonine protein kinase [Myxococcales bacterium]|nr:serine/threonine protein kinase [Myxococcales bacterium]
MSDEPGPDADHDVDHGDADHDDADHDDADHDDADHDDADHDGAATRRLRPAGVAPDRADTETDARPARAELTRDRLHTYRYRQELDWPDRPAVGSARPMVSASRRRPPSAAARSRPPAEGDADGELEADAEADADADADGTPGHPLVTGSTNRGHVVVDRDRELERQEHRATVGRMQRLMPLAVVLWLGFFFVDWVLATWVVPGELTHYLWLRLVGVLPILASWWRLTRDPPPDRRVLAGLDLVMTTSCATILALMCLLSGGLTSPYATYIAMVLAGRAASMPDHWRSGMVRLGVPALASPVVLALAYPFSPTLQQQLLDASARGTYFFYLMLIGGAWGLLVISSHSAWTLRRQVFRSRSIGRYRLERRIGEGGMGEVWVAWDDQLRRDVALKILRPEAGTEAAAVARFEREIMATAGLSHPNTVRIFSHGTTDDGLWYYAMELLEGLDLHELVCRDGPLPPVRALHVARQAAGALAEAHRRGIVHRDLKPENLFVVDLGGEPDYVKVLDFGIARITASDEPRLTGTGWVAGTPTYVSPEVASGGEAGPPADVYGLGGVLYFALTASPPFEDPNSARLLRLHVSAQPDTPSERLGLPLPARLEQTVMRCLAKSPDDRYADAGELAAALDECLLEARDHVAPPGVPPTPSDPRRTPAYVAEAAED